MKSTIISNMLWKFSERTGAQIVSFIVSIVLARLLLPAEYGLIAMVTVFISIASVLVDSGFGSALIQKKDVDDLDYSSIFFFNLSFSIILYIIIFICAPIIANFYGYKVLTPVMRILGLRLIFSGINTVQYAYIARNMVFKKFFFSTLGGTLISAVVGIVMAYKGYGIWALVAQFMVSTMVETFVIWGIVNWKPKMQFSLTRIRSMFSFGWKLLVVGVLDTLNTQSRALIIGKMYSANDLAYYSKGGQFPALIMSNINSSISAVMFPAASKVQDELEKLKILTRKSINISSYFIFPLMMGMAVVAEPMVRLLLTEKWIMTVPYLRIFCFIHVITIMQVSMQNAIMARGRSDVFLKMDIISKTIGITLLLLVINQGVMAIALIEIVIGSFNVVMKAIVSKRIIGYTFREHLADNIPTLIAATIMGVIVYMVNLLGFSSIATLSIQLPLGITIYFLLSMLFKLDGYIFVTGFLKEFKKDKRYE